MDTGIQNRTHEIYKQIHAYVAVIYIILVQSVYELALFRFELNNPVANIVINIAFNGLAYFFIYKLVLYIYMLYWIRNNKDCYVAGKWYHVHTRDDDLGYVRCGVVIIKQHFFDISVEAHNYHPVLKDGQLEYSNRSATHWKYILSELTDRGDIIACYSTSKKTGARRSNKGIHQLMTLEHDKKGLPRILDGDFADVYPSTAEGYIRLFKACDADSGAACLSDGDGNELAVMKRGFPDAPDEWVVMIRNVLREHDAAKAAKSE